MIIIYIYLLDIGFSIELTVTVLAADLCKPLLPDF